MLRRLPPILALILLATAASARAATLPLGPPSLTETRHVRQLAPGVTETDIVRGHRSAADAWTVTAGFVATRAEAQALAGRVSADGGTPRIERVDERPPDDPRPGPLGFSVRTGSFADKPAADAAAAGLVAAGIDTAVSQYTGEDGRRTTGPWHVEVVSIDPRRFTGSLQAALATGIVPGREPVSSLVAPLDTLAAVNGGYFVIGEADGTPGDLAGLSVIDGRLVSEPVNGRTDLLLPGGARAALARVRLRERVRGARGARRLVDGRNRGPGLIRSCGGVGGDQPTQRPLHDVSCTDPSELIRFTPDFGGATPTGPGREAVLDGAGRVTALRDRGGPIPPGGEVLAGTGTPAGWLDAHARPGTRLRFRDRLTADRRRLRVTRRLDAVNGGPRLLRAARPAIDAEAEGFDHLDDPGFYWTFGVRRNPRTMAGIGRDGRVLLGAVDGHQPDDSVGLSFREEARVMRALGAEDALNLDGGGSTTMTLGGALANHPSDATGERPVGDAVLVSPR